MECTLTSHTFLEEVRRS